MSTAVEEITFTNLLSINLTVIDQVLSKNFRTISHRLDELQRRQHFAGSVPSLDKEQEARSREVTIEKVAKSKDSREGGAKEATGTNEPGVKGRQKQLQILVSKLSTLQQKVKQLQDTKGQQPKQAAKSQVQSDTAIKRQVESLADRLKFVEQQQQKHSGPLPAQSAQPGQSRRGQSSTPSIVESRLQNDLKVLTEKLAKSDEQTNQKLAELRRLLDELSRRGQEREAPGEYSRETSRQAQRGEEGVDTAFIYKQFSQFCKKEQFQREKVMQNHRNGQIQQSCENNFQNLQRQLDQLRDELAEGKQRADQRETEIEKDIVRVRDENSSLRKQIRDVNEVLLLGDIMGVETQASDSLVPLRLAKLTSRGYDRVSFMGLRSRLEQLEEAVLNSKNKHEDDSYGVDSTGKSFQHETQRETKRDSSRTSDQALMERLAILPPVHKDKDDSAKAAELQRALDRKMRDLKQELASSLKSLERLIQTKQGRTQAKQQYDDIGNKIAQVKMLLGRKADGEGTRKAVNYLENNFRQLYEFLVAGQNERDALAAKRGWTCLSCDKSLLDYQGNVGDYVAWDRLPGNSPQKGAVFAKERAKSFLDRRLSRMNRTLGVAK